MTVRRSRTAIRSLPEAQRESLLLYTLGGQSYRQIADMTCVAEGTVRARVSDARKEIARQLAVAER